MPVFISHRTADDDKAQIIANHLFNQHRIKCYLDHFDPHAYTTRRITDLLMKKIHDCTHLMALITDSTTGSWWVPFEIGVARESDRRISSFDKSTIKLPEYLTEWPVLNSQRDLDEFAELYHKDKTAKPIIEKYSSYQRTISTADEFHSQLKAKLRM